MAFTVSRGSQRAFPVRTGFVQFHGRDGVCMEVSTSSVLVLPYTAASVGVARRRLLDDLVGAGVRDGTASDAGLVLSELVSNSLRHASPLPGHTIRASWRLGTGSVHIAVTDGGGATVPTVIEPVGWAVGGRGLGIVDRLSLRWGVYDADGVITVRAELPLRYGGTGNLVVASVRDA
jgi:anti-sigma regulatory factor (Ser/Thr protein kinase)